MADICASSILRFNSKLVRLKVDFLRTYNLLGLSFNSKLVRLKGACDSTLPA